MLRSVEPVTHLLTGACLSRALGLPSRVRYATAACVLAAELPDADYFYRLGGPLLYFQHHRGWTHALWSLPLQAALVTGLFYYLHQTRHIWKKHRSVDEPAPTNWRALFVIALMGLLSHIALDWTNNYGVRPFAPFVSKWYAGELFFIVEPILLGSLVLALLLPLLLSLVHREIGIRRPRYPGSVLAILPLLVIAGMLIKSMLGHMDAEALAQAQQLRGGAILRSSESPYPNTSSQWHAVLETPLSMQMGTMNLGAGVAGTGLFDTNPQETYPKIADTPFVTAAKASWLGRIYLDWSKFPRVVDAGAAIHVHPDMELTAEQGAMHVVRFSDLRFKYDTLFMKGASGESPLGAEAWVDSNLHVRRVFMMGAEQRISR